MFNLNTFLLLILISFTFQDKYCVVKFRFCDTGDSEPVISSGSITNCIDYDLKDNEKCNFCKEGYALSYDGTECILFPNCLILDENKKCIGCYQYYELNANGKCEKNFCQQYIDGICIHCYDGYYLNDQNKCIEIPISKCRQFDGNTEKCTVCLDGSSPSDGICKQRNNWMDGCVKYEDDDTCKECAEVGYTLKDGICEFDGCESGTIINYCGVCQVGYDTDDDGNCVGYDGSKDTSSSSENTRTELAMMIFILALLI